MDEKNFKKHLKEMIRGFHHPEEHDWAQKPSAHQRSTSAKPASRKAKPRARHA